MFEAQRLAKRDATKRLKGHLAEARRLVREAGIADSPIGERLARRLARGEHEIEMMSKIVDRVGRVRRAGELTAPYERLISLEREDRAEVRQLIDRLAELKAQATPLDAEVVYRVALADGRPLEAASTLPSGPSELSGEEGA
jgi:hypothetical protein